MAYRIDGEALAAFVRGRVWLIEGLPEEAAEVGLPDGLDRDEREAVWLAAGIAALIGQAISDEPERFICVVGPAGLAA